MAVDWTRIQRTEGVLVPLFFVLFITFQTNFINTGDAGELVSASYFLGIAHPSGYPLYLLLSKLATLLPFGNIAFKVTLISSFFGAINAYLVYKLIKNYTGSVIGALFGSLTLASAFSYFTQSVIAKFYQLNAFLILIIYILGEKALKNYSREIQYSLFFLLGLSLMLHQTVLLMLIPLSILAILHFKRFIKHIPLSILLFLLGFSGNIYLLIRGTKHVPLIMEPVYNWHTFWNLILRKAYGNGSTIQATERGLSHFYHIWDALKNVSSILYSNFHILLIPSLVLGLIFMCLRNKRLLLYYTLTLLSYWLILGLVTFTEPHPTPMSMYITGNQYYIPLLAFIALGMGTGIGYLVNLFSSSRAIKLAFTGIAIVPVFYLANTIILCNYSKDAVPYSRYTDLLFTKPTSSIIVVTGDNDVFDSWYMKNVERFRDDLCIISAATLKSEIWGFNNGCNPIMYKTLYPFLKSKSYEFNVAQLIAYMRHNRLYVSSPISVNKVLSKHTITRYAILYFLLYRKKYYKQHREKIASFIKSYRKKYKRFIHWGSCITNTADDFFTKSECLSYSLYLTYLAWDNQPRVGKRYTISIHLIGMKKKLKLRVGKRNIGYLSVASTIIKYNKLKDYYLINGQ